MTAPAIVAVVNPCSGRGRGQRVVPRLLAGLRETGRPFALVRSSRPGEARSLAAEAARTARLIVAVGGDGTLNEVANGILDAGAGRSVALGVVHAGRGGDVARLFGLPRDPAAAIARIVAADPRPFDAGLAELADGPRRAFLNSAGAGFDAAVAARAARSRLPGDTLPYLLAALATLVAAPSPFLTVEADGARWEGRFRLAMVANGPTTAGGLRLAPSARPDDGRLDLALVGDLPLPALLAQVPGVYAGRHVRHPSFTHVSAREIAIRAGAPLPVEVDGEVIGETPVRFTILPAALMIAA